MIPHANEPLNKRILHRLFQARMWREYAGAFDGLRTTTGVDRAWLEKIGHYTKERCVRQARVNLHLARRLRTQRQFAEGNSHG